MLTPTISDYIASNDMSKKEMVTSETADKINAAITKAMKEFSDESNCYLTAVNLDQIALVKDGLNEYTFSFGAIIEMHKK